MKKIKNDSLLKKRLILEKFKSELKDISPQENSKLEELRKKNIKLTKAEKNAKQKAEYEASIALTDDKKLEMDNIFEALIQATTPEDKVKQTFAILDSSKISISNIVKYQKYVRQICPEFVTITKLFGKLKRSLKEGISLKEEENCLIEEYISYIATNQ